MFGHTGEGDHRNPRSAMSWQSTTNKRGARRDRSNSVDRSASTPKPAPVADLRRMLIKPLATGETSVPFPRVLTFEWCRKYRAPEAIAAVAGRKTGALAVVRIPEDYGVRGDGLRGY